MFAKKVKNPAPQHLLYRISDYGTYVRLRNQFRRNSGVQLFTYNFSFCLGKKGVGGGVRVGLAGGGGVN